VLLGKDVAAFDAFGQTDLLRAGEQGDLPDRAQIQAQRVKAGFDSKVEFGGLLVDAGAQLGDGFEIALASSATNVSSSASTNSSSSISATAVPVAGVATVAVRISTLLLT
jgi:hypothetical protein